MSDDTLPPVGATVTDADGDVYEVESNALGQPRWVTAWGFGGFGQWLGVERDARPILTALWRLQQERDQLKAELAAFRALAVEAARPKLGTAQEVAWVCTGICDSLAALAPKEASHE